MSNEPIWKLRTPEGKKPFACSTYYHLCEQKKGQRFCLNQGGSRSGKTYSTIDFFIRTAARNKNAAAWFTICRKTFNALRGSGYRDFTERLKELGIYNDAHHNKTEHIYELFGNYVEFIGADDGQKLRSRKRNMLYIMEANELPYLSFVELNMRTSDRVIMDWNPSEEFWAEDLKSDPLSDFYITTYKDNPFLPEMQVREIERLKLTNPQLYKVMGEGLFAELKGLVFPLAMQAYQVPELAKFIGYGLDFGFSNDVTALVECWQHGDDLYFKTPLYETGMTADEIAKRFKLLGVARTAQIVADGARPESIKTIQQYGFNIVAAQKGAGSVKEGIDRMKKYNLYFIGPEIWKERNRYVWKQDNNGNSLNEPVDIWNHAMDAARYLVTWKDKPKVKTTYDFRN